MTQISSNDQRENKKGFGMLATAFIPLFGYFALIYMGDKAKKKSWKTAGLIQAAVSIVGVLFYLFGVSSCTDYSFREITPTICIPLLIAAYIFGIIFVLVNRKPYSKRVVLINTKKALPHALVRNNVWCRKQLRWQLWSYIPVLGGLCFLFIGYRTGTKRWKTYGWLYTIFAAVAFSLLIIAVGNYDLGKCILVYPLSVIIAYITVAVHASVVRSDYLRMIAPGWDERHMRLPCLNDRSWRRRNSMWMIWSYIPFCGGASLLHVGIRMRTRRWIIAGLAFIVANIVFGVVQNTVVPTLSRVISYELQDAINTSIWLLHAVMWIGTFFACTVIRERYLEYAAEQYGGDAEAAYTADLKPSADQQRFAQAVGKKAAEEKTQKNTQSAEQAMQKIVAQNTAEAMAHETVEAASQASEKRIDINSCSQRELMTLPGISLAQAKRALEYREQNSGFKDSDTFVKELGIKPHFAVQILDRITVSVAAVKNTKRAYRTLDI